MIAAGALIAVRRAGGPAPGRYRVERIDRGPIRCEVAVPGMVSAVIHDLSRMQVRATVNEADVGPVAVGDRVAVCGRPCPDGVFTGTVSEVRPSPRRSPEVEGDTVLVEADNHDRKLLPGMAVMLSIEVARRDGVLRLPLGALHFVPPGAEPAAPTGSHVGRVYLLDHGRPRPVRVTIDLEDPYHAELVAGPLREGDAVIVEQERGSQRTGSVR